MDFVVRYGEIGTKSGKVRSRLANTLRQRIEDRLDFESLEYRKVSRIPGRIVARDVGIDDEMVEEFSLMPGVKSCSPAYRSRSDLQSLKKTVDRLEVGESFGVRANTKHGDSQEIERKIGDYVLEEGREVDLEDPDTWIRIDVRDEEAFVFGEKFEGPGGFPAGSEGSFLSLISGGNDSPVAAYRMMTRGADITPLYFYNRPYSTEDHLIRFQKVIEELKKFHPSRKWEYYVIDMKQANEKLESLGSGRMVVQRRIMLRLSEKIVENQNLDGIVTGESMGQKSSQTSKNLETTSRAVENPVHRPLISMSKSEITSEAREIGTFRFSKIRSTCRDISPENPSTNIESRKVEDLESKIGSKKLVKDLYQSREKKSL